MALIEITGSLFTVTGDHLSIKTVPTAPILSTVKPISLDHPIMRPPLSSMIILTLFQDIRSLDKEMRAWDAFNGLDALVKNMMTSLRAVGELQNPSIRDRHWEQLMRATQVWYMYSPCNINTKSDFTIFNTLNLINV